MIIDDLRKFRDKLKTSVDRKELEEEFASVINKHSLENDSNTPDFILAAHLVDCPIDFHLTVSQRSLWYNPDDKG